MFDYYPELPIDPPEPDPVATCAYCGGEIYEGDDVLCHDGDLIHEDCAHDYALKILIKNGAYFTNAESEDPYLEDAVNEALERRAG